MIPDTTVVVRTDSGCFTIRMVRPGGKYGRYTKEEGFLLFHEGPGVLVEFYDLAYGESGEYGQFVTRYYLSTLMANPPVNRLVMDYGVPRWHLDAQACSQTRLYLAQWVHLELERLYGFV